MSKDQLYNLVIVAIGVPYTAVCLIGLLTRDIDWLLPWMAGLGILSLLLVGFSTIRDARKRKR